MVDLRPHMVRSSNVYFLCMLRRMLQTQSNPRGQGKIPTTHEGDHYFKGCP